MEDAYVIGIRLALENGVSAGIATIAADLAQLDAAIATTATNLRTLQSAAGPVDLPRRTTPPPTPVDPILPPAQIPLPPPPNSFSSPVARGDQGDGRPQTPEPASPSVPTPSTAPVFRILTQTTVPSVPDRTDQSPVAPLPFSSILRGESQGERQAAPPAPPQPLAALLRYEHARPLPTAAPSAPTPQTKENRAETTVAPLPPPPPPYPAVTPVAPPPREGRSASISGDVYLDGTRLGRWMSDRLARDADRPQAGVTGFDPRLGPAWPGPMQGN